MKKESVHLDILISKISPAMLSVIFLKKERKIPKKKKKKELPI